MVPRLRRCGLHQLKRSLTTQVLLERVPTTGARTDRSVCTGAKAKVEEILFRDPAGIAAVVTSAVVSVRDLRQH